MSVRFHYTTARFYTTATQVVSGYFDHITAVAKAFPNYFTATLLISLFYYRQ